MKKIDLVNFRNSEDIPFVVADAIAIGARGSICIGVVNAQPPPRPRLPARWW
jgi:predicted CoA-binding protein